MRWFMNALLVSSCSLTWGSSMVLAQAPEKATAANQQAAQKDESPKAQEGKQNKPDDQAKQAGDARRPAAEDARRERGPGGPGPFGGPGGPGPRMMLARLPLMMALDADGDGEISTQEMDGAVAALKKLDKNSDGRLTMEELMPEGMRGPLGGPGFFDPEEMVNRMMMADTNNDGFIDQDEMPERMKAMMLDRGDTNKDGKLSKEELVKLAAQMGRGQGRGGAGPRSDRDGADEGGRRRRPESE